jgi:galactokinase/mevalonate kinase-like predicted kinase
MSTPPFNVYGLVDNCKSIEGYDLIKELMSSNIVYADSIKFSIDEVVSEYSDWPAGQGFGSSDGTYAKQSFVDHMINYCGLSSELKTTFNPYLCVIKL